VIVPVGIAIARDLSIDDAGVAVELTGDLDLLEALVQPAHDDQAFVETEPVPAPARPVTIAWFGQAGI
jgi:hypothetical protein